MATGDQTNRNGDGTLRRQSAPGRLILFALAAGILATGVISAPAAAADIEQARQAFYRGDYEVCIELTRAEVDRGMWNVVWSEQLIQALLLTGQYEAARDTYESVKPKFEYSLPLRLLGAEAYRYCGQYDVAKQLLGQIPELVQRARWRFTELSNMLAIGKYSLGLGEDARDVLAYYEAILKRDGDYTDAHVAIAELALSKADFQEAANALKLAADQRPEDPHIHFLQAKAWSPSDSQQAATHLATALKINPLHPESLLLQAENLIDSEDYDEAEQVLATVLDTNPSNPAAWALRAAIAHLQGDYSQEGTYRKKGLAHHKLNAEVDHLIGKKLSQHYRFSESVNYQRRALHMDPNFAPAKFQLAQDLLRTGADDEGWTLVDQVVTQDRYNVVAFNLGTLQKKLAEFTSLQQRGIILRMDAREAQIYGDRVMRLLQEAKEELCAKYDMQLLEPVTVEIFPRQSDFAIRTFGLPGGAGFLGVCFGSLITANSPASQGDSPSNWESVLWHEFCHVVTLQKTKNRMPRWLSEGISVYEELQRDASWGQRMTPTYRQMILGEDFVPLSELSGAFLNPETPLHLQFAYFESALAVEYLVESQGMALLRQLLVDLGMGVPIAEALARRYGDPSVLDQQFWEFTKQRAESFASQVDFSESDVTPRASAVEIQAWLKANPNHYAARQLRMRQLVEAEQFDSALLEAEELLEVFPDDVQPGGALEIAARCARQLGETELELKHLTTISQLTSDNLPALRRIIEIHQANGDWKEVSRYAEKFLAVQPMLEPGHEAAVVAARELNRPAKAIDSLRALQEMEPTDPARLHYELAHALEAADQLEEARREALSALEFTPRYREAQKLLVALHQRLSNPDTPAQLSVSRPSPGSPPSPALQADSD